MKRIWQAIHLMKHKKEFLIKCLEEGDTVEEMKTYASASLTPAMMQRLRQVRKKRRGQ